MLTDKDSICYNCLNPCVGEEPYFILERNSKLHVKMLSTCETCFQKTFSLPKALLEMTCPKRFSSFSKDIGETDKLASVYVSVIQEEFTPEIINSLLKTSLKNVPMILVVRLGIRIPIELDSIKWYNTHVFDNEEMLALVIKLVEIESRLC